MTVGPYSGDHKSADRILIGVVRASKVGNATTLTCVTRNRDIGGFARPFLLHRSDDFAFQRPGNGTRFASRPVELREGGGRAEQSERANPRVLTARGGMCARSRRATEQLSLSSGVCSIGEA